MPRKPKPPLFKKGDKVIYLNNGYHPTIIEAEVSATRGEVVCTRHPDRWGGFYRRAFSPEAGNFQQDPYPIWQLMLYPGPKVVKNIEKRLRKAAKNYDKFRQAYEQIERDVQDEARQWAREESSRRQSQLKHGGAYIDNVIRRAGFKKPTRAR